MSSTPLVNLVTDDQVKDQAKQIFDGMKEKMGQVPKWMRVMANCDDIFVGFFTMFKATMDETPLSAELKWKIAFIISEENKCDYCVSVSEMQLKAFGMEGMDAEKLHQEANDREKLAIEWAKSCNSHAYKINPELIEKVKAEFTDEEMVELTAVVGLFNYINRFNDALRILPD